MIKNLLKKEISKQFMRFCFVGIESAVLTFLVFIILFNFLLVNYIFAFAGGFIAGTFFGFIFNKIWSFKSKRESKKEVGLYFLIYTISLIVGIFFIKFLVNSFELNPIIANIPVLALTTIINFFGTKIFVFKNAKW